MEIERILFFILSALILLTAGLAALRPRPIESAMWLILNFFITAALYVLLGSHFVAVIQVLVYAGAIMVLFVFIILLLNLDPHEVSTEAVMPWTHLILACGALSFVMLSLSIIEPATSSSFGPINASSAFGTIENIANQLVTHYMWSFEIAGVILLLAIIGVGMLAYRKQKHVLKREETP